jgi:hypothetical protein
MKSKEYLESISNLTAVHKPKTSLAGENSEISEFSLDMRFEIDSYVARRKLVETEHAPSLQNTI